MPHTSSITVYPKDGGEPRQASFVDTFKEQMIVSANIRYFFPEGCKGPRIEVDELKVQPNPASPMTKTVVTAPPLQNTAGKTFGVSVSEINGGFNGAGLKGGPNGAGLKGGPNGAGIFGPNGGAGSLEHSNRGSKQLFGNGKGGSGAGNLNGNNNFGSANGNNPGGFGNANGFGANNGRNTGSGGGFGPNGGSPGSLNGRDRDLKQIFEDNLSLPIRPNVPALYDVPKTPGSVQTKSSVNSQSSVQTAAQQKSIPKNEDKKVVINRQPENVVASISAQAKTSTVPAKPVAPISSGITVKPKTSATASAITVKPKTASVTAKPSVNPVRPSAQQAKSSVSTSSAYKSSSSTSSVSNPSLISTPLVKSAANDKCSDTCCDDNRPQILMSRASAGSCCKGVSKIVIPIDTDALSRISMSEIIEITSNETSNVKMLQKLLSLAEKYNL